MRILHKVQNKESFVREHERGDVREDGKVFESYRYVKGKVYERWCSPEQLVVRKALSNKSSREWAKRPENKARLSKLIGASNKRMRQIRPARFLLSAAKTRAKQKGLPFNLEVGDVLVPTLCPALGIPLAIGSGMCSDNSPSIDRVIPELGYVKGNINVISRRANRIKNDATPDELYRVWKYASEQF